MAYCPFRQRTYGFKANNADIVAIRNYWFTVLDGGSGVIWANHWGGLTFPNFSTTTLRLSSPCYVMCDTPKNVSIELAALLLYHQKNIANSFRYRNG